MQMSCKVDCSLSTSSNKMSCRRTNYTCNDTNACTPCPHLNSFCELTTKSPNTSLTMSVLINVTENQRGLECHSIEKNVPKNDSASDKYDRGETVHDTHYACEIVLGITIGVLFVLLLIVFIGWTGVFLQQHRKLKALGKK